MEVCRRWIEEQRSFIVPQAFLERISRSSHGLKVTRGRFVLTDPMGEEEVPFFRLWRVVLWFPSKVEV
jgi:hypothetical protein